ncbi:hypothetical protein G436_1243 [Leptospira interrogans serovar Hardjo str. Norma]|uniref:Uncharacterized protein n=1 Tax=Leptospira interrogans serovar Hardjo str. Norma TaxID=1279460 RepID=A0A0M4NI49_LEPIR|nr:hypothetical protein G436_1243 [Leptospira interrogans serovar Hardjo str. Norma]
MAINKTASIADLHKIETDGELIFQQFYLFFKSDLTLIRCIFVNWSYKFLIDN